MSSLRRDLLTLFVGALVALSFLAFAFYNGGSLPATDGDYEVEAALPSAVRLAPGSRVKVAGLDVGKVTDLDEERDSAIVRMKIDDDYAPVPKDSRVRVRLRTVAGENYVELRRGRSPQEAPSGGRILPFEDDEYVEVDQILSVLKGKTRERARDTLQGLATGLDARGGRLNRLLEGAAGTIEAATPMTEVIAARHRQLARFVDRLGEIGRAVGERGRATRTLAAGLRGTAEAVARRDDALRATLDELPDALQAVRRTSGTLRGVSQRATPIVAELAGTVSSLRPSVERLRPAGQELRGVMRELAGAAPPLTSTLASLRRAAPPTGRALTGLRSVLCQLTPFVDHVAPYAREVAAVVTNMSSASNFYDATGHAARLQALVSEDSLVFHTPEISKTVTALTETGVIGRLKTRGFDPFPAPGTIADPKGGEGSVGMEDNKIAHPDIKAAC